MSVNFVNKVLCKLCWENKYKSQLVLTIGKKSFSKVKYIVMSKLIQKHFRKIVVGTGLGLTGVLQYLPQFGETIQKDAVQMGNDFMDVFSADLRKEMETEIKKFSQRIARGETPKTEEELVRDMQVEAVTVEKDLVAAFHKDINITIEKEVLRLSKRILHDTS